MNIDLTTEEASILVGVFTVWLQHVPRFSKEYESIMGIVNKVLEEDKKQVDKALNKTVVR